MRQSKNLGGWEGKSVLWMWWQKFVRVEKIFRVGQQKLLMDEEAIDFGRGGKII